MPATCRRLTLLITELGLHLLFALVAGRRSNEKLLQMSWLTILFYYSFLFYLPLRDKVCPKSIVTVWPCSTAVFLVVTRK
jgi:hypothetical protein